MVWRQSQQTIGEMAEWSNATVLKTVVLLRAPRVRIRLSPPLKFTRDGGIFFDFLINYTNKTAVSIKAGGFKKIPLREIRLTYGFFQSILPYFFEIWRVAQASFADRHGVAERLLLYSPVQ